MKKFFVFAILASLVACKQKGDTRSSEGIIIAAVQALSEGNADVFKSLLSERALEQYGRVDQQQQLKQQLGNVRQLQISKETVLSHSTLGNSTMTVSQIDVSKSGRIIYNVITRCTETRTTSTRQVCNTYDPNPPLRYDHGDDYDHGHQGGGGYDGGYDHGNDNDGGGHATPGPSHPAQGDDNGDGHKPGNQDPDRPGRFPIIEAAYSNYGLVTECHDVTNTDVSVSCKIIDLK